MKKYNTNLFGQKLNVSQAIDSNAEGKGTITKNIGEHAEGTFNISNTGSENSDKTIHSIGIGTKDSERANALEIMQNGDIYLYGIGGYEGNNASDSKSIQSVIQDSQSSGDYTLPIASADTLGGIKVGEGLNIDGEGVLSSTGSGVGKVDPNSDGTGEIFNDYSNNEATGQYSHAEGYNSSATGYRSHAEGDGTIAIGQASHAEGHNTTAKGIGSHAEGQETYAGSSYSHTEGFYTIAKNNSEHAQGKNNVSNTGQSDSDKTIHSIGIGIEESARKNAVEVMTNGDVYINGIGGYDGTNYAQAQTLQASLFEPITIDVSDATSSFELFDSIAKQIYSTKKERGLVYIITNGKTLGISNFYISDTYEEGFESEPTININGVWNFLLLPSETMEHIKEQIGGSNLESSSEIFGRLALDGGLDMATIYGITSGSIINVYIA